MDVDPMEFVEGEEKTEKPRAEAERQAEGRKNRLNGKVAVTVALLANIDPELAFRPAQKVLIASLLVIAAVALRRLTLAANKLWTRRYIQSTIPSP